MEKSPDRIAGVSILKRFRDLRNHVQYREVQDAGLFCGRCNGPGTNGWDVAPAELAVVRETSVVTR